MKSCWDPDPEKRPSITKVRITLGKCNSSKEYISRELEFDLDFSNRSDTLGTKRKIEEININSHGNNGKY
ncbi:unnamed protein product [Rhizophagus irregularis]|nr:unnamed protein product [Rhizophagus irregularis]CAB5393865.1 unnamed protein product [Rhizophagus irregularis]